MDHPLGDTLTIEMSKEVDQVEILEQERAILANPLELLGVWDRGTIGSCVDRLFGVLEGGRWLIVGNHDGVVDAVVGLAGRDMVRRWLN
jgi:hypothetical protein